MPLGFIAVFAVWFLLSPDGDESRTERRLLAKLIDFSQINDALFLYSASVINNSETIK